MSHNKRTKAQHEYVKGMIQNLSLQRLTDQEIVEYLHNEKQIDIARPTVTNTRNRLEKQAANWYIDLRSSTTKYIAAYKERIDSLLSYQKKLHEISAATKREEIKIRAISELHSIEKTIFDMWKQLPNLDIVSTTKQDQNQEQTEDRRPPMVDDDDIYGTPVEPWDMPSWFQCDGCKRWWRRKELLDYHQKKGICTNTSTNGVAIATIGSPNTAEEDKPEISTKTMQKVQKNLTSDEGQGEQEREGEDGGWKQLQCPACNKWFMNNFTLSAHRCTGT